MERFDPRTGTDHPNQSEVIAIGRGGFTLVAQRLGCLGARVRGRSGFAWADAQRTIRLPAPTLLMETPCAASLQRLGTNRSLLAKPHERYVDRVQACLTALPP